jgi:hypothetical protein
VAAKGIVGHVTSSPFRDLRSIDMLTGEIAVEVIWVVGVSPALWYFRHIASIFLTMDTYVAAKGIVGHVTSSPFRSFSGFIIYKY